MIIPKEYQKLNALPEDPEECVTYGKQTEGSLCIVSVYPILSSNAMDFNGKESLIDGIHRSLAVNQAIIEVDSGFLDSGKRYIYSLIKTKLKPSGVQYFLLMHIQESSRVTAVKAFFDEQGITGIRDNMVLELYYQKQPNFSLDQWTFDPYDSKFKADYKMNLSEQAMFDDYFPNFIFSFLLSSLYLGSATKKLAKKTRIVIIYVKIEAVPHPIIFPISPNTSAIIIGISLAPIAATIAKLAGDTACPNPIVDTIKVIIYNAMYFFDIALVNILFFLVVLSILIHRPSYCFLNFLLQFYQILYKVINSIFR